MKLAVLVFAAAVALATSEAPSVSAANSRTYVDRVGDVFCCTRDISRVEVANDDAGRITFTITALNTYEAADDDDDIYIDIDADRDRSTGLSGSEYRIAGEISALGPTGAVLGRVDRLGNFGELRGTRVRASSTGDVFRFTIDRHLLADTDRFRFSVTLWEVAQGGAYSDVAPEAPDGDFAVRIALARIQPALTTSAPARAGQVVVARLALRIAGSLSMLASGRINCRATVAGKRLRVLRRGFVGRRATCSWRIPRGARGAAVRGTIGVFVTRRASSHVSRQFHWRIT